MTDPASQGELRDRFLRVAYDLTVNRSMPFVNIQDVSRELGLPADRATLFSPTSEINGLARYWGTKGSIKSQTYGYETFSLTPEGMDEAEGKNRQEGFNTTFNLYGNVQGSVVGTHNTNTFTGDLDFSTVERRIEAEGGDDKDELRQLVAEMRELLESGQTLDKGFLARFNDKLKEHGWLSGAVAGWLLNFSTQ